MYIDSVCDQSVNIIVFWATWCKGCKKELDFIKENYEDSSGVKIIAVSQDKRKNRTKMINLINTKKWEFYYLWDSDMKLGRSLGVYALPTTIVVNEKGKILFFKTGFGKKDKDKIVYFLKSGKKKDEEQNIK